MTTSEISYEEISAPYIQLGIFNDKPEREAFRDVCNLLLSWGAVPINIAQTTCIEKSQRYLFGSISDVLELQTNYRDLNNLLNDNSCDVLLTWFVEAVGSKPNTKEWVTFNRISDTAIGKSKHPIAIIVDGMGFDLPNLGESEFSRVTKAGQKIYTRFWHLVEALDPLYGAINIEDSLMCPIDMKMEDTYSAFYNFYISNRLLTKEERKNIQTWYSGAYFKQLESGLYVSINKHFNPTQQDWDKAGAFKWTASSKIQQLISMKF